MECEFDQYDMWRDDACDRLFHDVKRVVENNLHNGTYYVDKPEKFVDHVVELVKELSSVQNTEAEKNFLLTIESLSRKLESRQ